MAEGFEGLGIGPELAAGAASLGWNEPTRLQVDALPMIRRGNNVVLHASAGSGVTGAWGVGLLDRLATGEPGDGWPRALVLAADEDTAAGLAGSLARIAVPAGLSVRSHGPGWLERPVDVLVLSPAAAAEAVRASTLKGAGVVALVVHGLDGILDAGQADDLETLTDVVPSGAQRVVVTGRLGEDADSFIERHARKALTIPPRPKSEPPSGGPRIRYAVVTEHGKPAAVVALLGGFDTAEVAVVCRTPDRAESLERALVARGVLDLDARVLVLPRAEADRRSTRAAVVSADVPFDPETLADLHGGGGTVLVTPRERGHLRRIAARIGADLVPVPDPAPGSGAPARVRDRLREIIRDEDLAAELALLEPLLTERSAAEVAAAALRLARQRHGSAALEAAPGAPAAAPPSSAGARSTAAAPPPSGEPTWTHLFVTVGKRDGVGPGDIVGAMTGEAGIEGDQVGKIDIRESHTTVEVATTVAARVIDALNGRTLKGRSLRVDYDRKTRSGPAGPDRGRAGSRPPSRRRRS